MRHVSEGDWLGYLEGRMMEEEARVMEEEAPVMFWQLASVVQYCHHSDIIHRGLKPENILRDAEPTGRLQPE